MRGEEEFYPWNVPPRFPDPAVHSFWVDLFYRGAVVYREMLVGVDGWRAILPVAESRPAAVEDESGSSRTREFEGYATRRECEFARLIDALNGHRDFDGYFTRSGFTIL